MKKNTHMIFRVSDALRDEVKTETDRLGMSISDFVNCACELLLLVIREIEIKHRFQLKALLAKMREELKKMEEGGKNNESNSN